jgi:hypothetical protein
MGELTISLLKFIARMSQNSPRAEVNIEVIMLFTVTMSPYAVCLAERYRLIGHWSESFLLLLVLRAVAFSLCRRVAHLSSFSRLSCARP